MTFRFVSFRICCWLVFSCLVFCCRPIPVSAQAAGETPVADETELQRRQRYLEELLQIIEPQIFKENTRRVTLQDSTWMGWLERSGELPPDFSAMPSDPFLPNLLTLSGRESLGGTAEGGPQSAEAGSQAVEAGPRPIRSREDWARKRNWIKKNYQHWISGTFPPPPEEIKAEVLEDRQADGVRIQLIRLNFGPGFKARMTLELMIPLPGDGQEGNPLPVYMTQWNHRNWAQLAVRRGYIACVYAAADVKDDTQAYQELYPDYDFSMIMRRAWGASRVLDYLLTREEVNGDQVAITGHSRNGKQSLWAAAFDKRFGAVISSSSGTGGSDPWRYSGPQYDSETLDRVVAYNGHWFHPRLRFFFGREDKLPVDQHSLLSLIAPRPLLFHHSLVEHGYNPWANEQCYMAVKKVYDFLDAGDRIGLFARMGLHAVAARDVERCIDFLDIQFGRKELPWKNDLYFQFSFGEWAAPREEAREAARKLSPLALKESYADTAAFNRDRVQILRRLDWLLGEQPPGVLPGPVKPSPPSRVDWIDLVTGHPEVEGAELIHLGPYDAMGDHLAGRLYRPVSAPGRSGEKLPVIIYLHEYAYGHGSSKGYHVKGGKGNSRLFQALCDAGFAVLAIDLYGFGPRIKEAQYFYERYPSWSKMGKILADVRACVDAVGAFDFLDQQRVFLLGNTLGGSVALMAAARDQRIAGTAVVAAFSPWRKSNRQYKSLRSLSMLHGLMPRLGFFAESPETTPVDFGEIIACLAPRPLLVVAPGLDKYADPEAVSKTMEQVASVYELHGASGRLEFSAPPDINRITSDMYPQITAFFKKASLKQNKWK